MNKKAIIVALMASLAVSAFLWNQIQKKQQPSTIEKPVIEQPVIKKKVVVSKKRIAARTKLEASILQDTFELKELIASAVPDTAFTSIASLTNRYTSVTVLPDDIMTPIRLLDDDQIPNLARAIPVGKRAVSIVVSKASSVGGFIQQGDYVDVIATLRPRNGETITKVVLQDIQVLAMGNTYEFEGAIATMSPAIAASKVELVTLALTPDELEKLMYLEAGTNFRLVLKNPGDKDNIIQTKGATERIVLSDIGHGAAATPASGDDRFSRPSSTDFGENRVGASYGRDEEIPVDDGRVEIMFGSERRRELQKYGGPAAKKYKTLPDNPNIPSYTMTNIEEHNHDELVP